MRTKTNILEPDGFANDWYGWATNQISHIFLGVFFVFALCLSYFGGFGEMPSKMSVYAVVVLGYVAFEVFAQGWRGWDTVEDTVFVTGYGAAGVLSGFSEIQVGSAVVAVDVAGLAPFFFLSSLHLMAGVWCRAKGNC